MLDLKAVNGEMQFKNDQLAELIDLKRDSILDDWVHAVREQGGRHFRVWSDDQLRSIFAESLDQVIQALRRGTQEKLDDYLRDLVARRLAGGFEPWEVFQSVAALKNAVLKVINESIPDAAPRYWAALTAWRFYDLTMRRIGIAFQELQSAQQARLLALYELSSALGRTLKLDEVMRTAVDKIVDVAGATAAAIVCLYGERGEIGAMASRGMSPEFLRIVPGICHALKCTAHEAVVIEAKEAANIVPDIRQSTVLSEWHDFLVAQGCMSIACVPLLGGDRVIGVLIVFLPEPREVPAFELDFLLAAAGHTATAMQNAMLFEEAKGKRELGLLLDAAKLLSSTLDLEYLFHQIARLAAESFPTDFCGVVMPDEHGECLHTIAYHVRCPEGETTARRVLEDYEREGSPPGSFGPGQVFVSGQPMLMKDASQVPDMPKELVGVLGSALIAPMKLRSKVLGVFAMASARPGAFNEDDLSLAMGLADLAAIAVENARLYKHQKGIAEALQRSFLPESLPEVGDYEIAARYQAASEEAEVGGDFYDVFYLPDGRLVILIADVAGKGLQAAKYTAMGKYLLRAYVAENPDPTWLLGRMNETLHLYLPEGMFITAFYGILDAEHNELVYGNAGQGQAMMRTHPDGSAGHLKVTGPGLGVMPDASFGMRRRRFNPRDTLLMYTDGASDVQRGNKRLGGEGVELMFMAATGLTADQIADRVFRGVLEYGHGRLQDDIAILVLRRKQG